MSTRKKRRVGTLFVGVILLVGAGLWLLTGGPAWLGAPAVLGLVLVGFSAPRFDDGSPPEGPWWSDSGPVGGF